MRGASPIDYWRAGVAYWSMMAEAQAVIALRCMGMMGLWTSPPGEAMRMVVEKQAAFARASQAAALGTLRGDRPERIAEATIRPIGRKTRANVARLTKAGPVARPRKG